jgi:dihydrofolate reductase
MIVSAIAAMSENRVIGMNNQLPWHIPEDLKHFKETTVGKPVIMGRLTYESVGVPLPKRENIVITRNPDYAVVGCKIVHSVKEALDYCKDKYPEDQEVFIIGGAQIYKESLPLLNRIYLTIIHKQVQGDAFFPEVNIEDDFKVIEKRPEENKNYKFTFITAERS